MIYPIFLNWLIISSGLLLLELFSGSLFFLIWGIAGFLMVVIGLIMPNLSFDFQMIVFSILSLFSLVFWWKFTKNWKKSKNQSDLINDRVAGLIGRVVKVKEVIDGHLVVFVDDGCWRALGDNQIRAGDYVKILGAKETVLLVQPAN